jgi:site-specific DNA recombinase
VLRIFTEYAAGRGMTSIARGLTRDDIPCPSVYDRDRNPHRNTEVWETSAIRAILANPRYTGRQVWNRQRTDEVLIDVEDVSLGHENKHRWNDQTHWVWSAKIAHAPLIPTELFERTQHGQRVRGTKGEAGKAPRRSTRPYLYRGLITCGLCGRLMEGSFNHGRVYYRCAASRDFVRQHQITHPPCLYLRQESLTGPIDQFLRDELTREDMPATLRRLATAQHRSVEQAESDGVDEVRLRQTVADCDAKLKQYRAALDASGDAAVLAGWIKETTAIRTATQAVLGAQGAKPQRLTEEQINKIVEGFGGLLTLLQQADPLDRSEIYARMGLGLTYRPEEETVIAEIRSTAIDRIDNVCRRGDLNPHALTGH